MHLFLHTSILKWCTLNQLINQLSLSATTPTNTQLKSNVVFEWNEVYCIQNVLGSNLDSMLLIYRFRQIRGQYLALGGPGSVVGIATGYGLDGPGIEFRWGGKIFRTYSDRPWGPPSLLYNGYLVFPGGTEGPGRDADLSPPSNAVVMKE
jgi:hypothetical protein